MRCACNESAMMTEMMPALVSAWAIVESVWPLRPAGAPSALHVTDVPVIVARLLATRARTW